MSKRIIIDLDAGVDDAYALLVYLYAERKGQIKIEAIVCTAGNTNREHVCRNVVRLLEVTNRTDIPVYKGAFEPLIPPNPRLESTYHGVDGLGDVKCEREPDISLIKKENASILMNKLVQENPGEITMVCLGPLTTLAITLKLFVGFANNIKELYLMGGNYTGMGNITASAEFNFYSDPEAAFIVLDQIHRPITILPIEACLSTQINIEWRFDVLGKVNSPHAKLMTDVELSVYNLHRKNSRVKHLWWPCDAFLAAAMLYPQLIKKTSEHHATVELNGFHTRGQMIIDHLKQKSFNIKLIEIIDDELFKNTMIEVMA